MRLATKLGVSELMIDSKIEEVVKDWHIVLQKESNSYGSFGKCENLVSPEKPTEIAS